MVATSPIALLILTGTLLTPLAWADPLFDSQDVLQIRLTAPLRSLARDRDPDPEYRPGTLAYTDSEGHEVELSLKLRPRGNSRRKRDVCTFPPLRLNFAKKEVRGTLFDAQDKLKLVTHCRRSARHDPYIYKEYLAYRMLNELTDASFRVRGLKIEYVDLDRGGRSEERFGFLIEDKQRLAERLDLEAVEPGRIPPKRLEPEHASLMELFEFMIGNTDFSFIAPAEGDHCCHNSVLLENDQGFYLPMPYDFDISGFVDPPYAVVGGGLPIANVRERLYRGLCREMDVRVRAVERMRSARGAILEIVSTETPLSGRSRDSAQRYTEEFFAILEDPRRREQQILKACRG